jgi:hypothetical protein
MKSSFSLLFALASSMEIANERKTLKGKSSKVSRKFHPFSEYFPADELSENVHKASSRFSFHSSFP